MIYGAARPRSSSTRLPHAPKPEGLPKNVVWREQPRFDIPGSVWLPDTGYGALSEATQRYLEKGLARASGGDKGKPLVFYCLHELLDVAGTPPNAP